MVCRPEFHTVQSAYLNGASTPEDRVLASKGSIDAVLRIYEDIPLFANVLT